jgi:hypothetical protein
MTPLPRKRLTHEFSKKIRDPGFKIHLLPMRFDRND